MKNCYFIYHRKSNELTAIAIKKEDVSHYTLFRGKENFMSHKVSYPSEEDIKILLSDHIDLVLYQDQKMELLWNNKEKSKIENGIHYLLFFSNKGTGTFLSYDTISTKDKRVDKTTGIYGNSSKRVHSTSRRC